MHNNKELYTFLLDHSGAVSKEWTKAFDPDDLDSFFSAADPKRLAELEKQCQLFIIHLSKVFLVEQGMFFSSLDRWIQQVAQLLQEKKATMEEVIGQLRRVRMIYWEKIGEFIELHGSTVAYKEIMLWSDLIYIAFEEIIASFSRHFKEADNSQKEDEVSVPAGKLIELAEGIGLCLYKTGLNQKNWAMHLRDIILTCQRGRIHRLIIDLSAIQEMDKEEAERIYQLRTSLQAIGVEYQLSGLKEPLLKQAQQRHEGLEDMEIYSSILEAIQP